MWMASNLSRRHLKLLRKPSNRRAGLTFTSSVPVYQITLRSHNIFGKFGCKSVSIFSFLFLQRMLCFWICTICVWSENKCYGLPHCISESYSGGAYSNISQDTEFPELCFMFSLALLGRYVDSTLKCAITTSTSFPGYFHLPIIWWYVIWINDVFCSQRNTEYHLVCKSKYCNNPIVNFKTVSSTI